MDEEKIEEEKEEKEDEKGGGEGEGGKSEKIWNKERTNGRKEKKVGEKEERREGGREGGREEEGKEERNGAIIAQNYIGTLGNRMSILECKYYLLQQVNTVLGLDRY